MPRPRMNRRIGHQPPVRFYKPQGIPMGQLRGVTLTLDGLEAIRLADAEGLDHEEAAERMDLQADVFEACRRGTRNRGAGPCQRLGHPHRRWELHSDGLTFGLI